MATFSFSRDINIHWNGYDVKGPAGTVFSIPDQLYEEFEGDIRNVEPSLTWIDTNEFQTLTNNVSAATLSASLPIALTTSTSGKTISLSSTTALNGYLLAADGTGGTIWTPASTSGITSVVGVSPISAVIAGGTVSVSLDANYQTAGSYQPAGTYVTSVIGTSPISTTGTTAITVSVNQASLSVANATTAEGLRTYVKNTSGSTMTKGQAVYISGADGTNVTISLSSASTEATSSKTLGLLAQDLANNAFGWVVENGYLGTIDTSAATAGQTVWLGNTPGSLVFGAPPAEPSHSVYLGVVARSNANNGEIIVKVQNGYELDELHDVFVGGVSTALPLVYSSTSSGWIAQALSSVGIADNAIVASKINAGSVGSAALADNAVVAAKIAASAVGSAAIASGSINSTHIGANAVVLGDIAAGAVDSAALASNAVVAAKIAAAAVGTAAISSGAATSGQLLQANGSGGVAFATVASAGLVINAATQTVISGAMVTSAYNTSAAKASGTVSAAIALDTTSNRVFQIVARNQIASFSAIDGSAISTATITAVLAAEQLQDMAFGASKLVVITGQTAALNGASKYYVIDPSTLTVQNSGTLVPAGTVTTQGDPKIKFDNALGEFVVFGAYGTTATSVQTGGYIRTINASTYSTRTHDNANWESAWGDGTRTFPVWINVNSANRWAIGETGARITFWSDSGAATGFATQTGLADFGPQTGVSSQLFIDSSDNTNLIYAEVSETSGHLSSAFHIKFSEISSAYNSSTIDLSSLVTNARSIDIGSTRGTDLIYKTIGGKQWLVAPVSLVSHVYASTRTSQTSDISSDFLTDYPWTPVWGASSPSGDNWTNNWTNACDIGYDGTEWYVIHATSNTSFHGVVKQKVRAVQTIDLLGTTVTSPSIVSPGNYFPDGTTPIASPKTYPSSVLATFNSGTSADTSSNSLYLVASGATWTLNVYPGFSATGTNTKYATPGRMIIRS